MRGFTSIAILDPVRAMPDADTIGILPGVSFEDRSLLQQAFIHDSYVNENQIDSVSSNERLEFLGDAVVNLAAARLVYDSFPQLPEGQLTAIRSSLVCTESLADLATDLDLGSYLLLGRGEEQSGGRAKKGNLASAFEALMGALYLDQGPDKALGVTADLLKPQVQRVRHRGIRRSYKALLQELVQQEGHSPPTYRLLRFSGPDHAREFTVEVEVNGEAVGQGTGRSKKAAEAGAAKEALKRLRSGGAGATTRTS